MKDISNICVALEEGGQKSFADAEIAQLSEQVADRNRMIAAVEQENDNLREQVVKLQAMIERVRGR